MLKYSEFIIENINIFLIKFKYKDDYLKFTSSTFRGVYTDVINWLYKNGYKFDENVVQRKLFKKNQIPRQYLGKGLLYNLPDTELYIIVNLGNSQSISYLKKMLKRFGIDNSTFEFKKNQENEIEDLDLEPVEQEPIEPSKPSTNPFEQAICVLGESGAGKSYTIENILESSNHNYQFIIPTAATTGLLAQYSPSKSAYVPSRLGKMLIESSNNPSELYTAVFDECHKSNVIEMINDELLQAISLRRNRYRFISLDDDTAEVFEDSNLEVERGNIKIPDNFGFIFISSNPRVIGGNPDFFNRVDLIEVTEADRKINNIEELLSKKVEESSDKRELIDKLRSK